MAGTISSELEVKLNRLYSLMDKEGYDAVFIKRQDNFSWLSCGGRNYVGMGETGNCGLLVKRNGERYAITNNIEAPRMKAEERLEDMGFSLKYDVWYNTDFEKKTLSELVPSGKIGYDTSNAQKGVQLLRFDLTPEEIARYQEIGKDASIAMETAGSKIEVGMTEYEIAAMIIYEMEKKGLEILSCMVAADDRIDSFRHPLPTWNRVEKKVQIGGNFRRNGLVICLTRYVYFGSALTEKLHEQYRHNQIIDCTYMHASKPGKTFVSALEAGKKAYETLGYDDFKDHHQGGPIGYAGRDYRVDFSTPGVIADHQAFCWNPSIRGTKSEDTVICTKDGTIPVTRPELFPKVKITVDGEEFERADILVK